jgi:glycosyltransferase involved in cell wall biosynthesis
VTATVPPEVSVIIPCYNRQEFTLEAVESALAQPGVAVEVIVIDDGSTDDTVSVLREAHPGITLIQNEHRGANIARNTGLLAARGTYVKFLDSDDRLSEGSLTQQLAFARAYGADVCYGDFEFFGDLSAPEVGGQSIRRPGSPPDIVVALLGSWWSPPSSYLFRRDALAGLAWDEELQRCQDMDFVLQVALSGARFAYQPVLTTYKRAHHQGRIMDCSRLVYGHSCEIIADKVLRGLTGTGKLTEETKQAIADLYWHASRLLWKESPSGYRRLIRKIGDLYLRFIPGCPTYAGPKMRLAVKWLGPAGSERLFDAVSRLRSRTGGASPHGR